MSSSSPTTTMNPFLDDNTNFKMFGMSHLAALSVFLFLVALAALFGRRFSPDNKRRVCLSLCVLLQLTVVIWSIIRIWTGKFIPSVDLPFDVCNLTALVFLPIMLLTKNQILFDAITLTASLGTSQAFVTPHLFDEIPHITYFKFFIVHGGIILGAIISAVMNDMRFSKSFWRTVLHYHLFMTGNLIFSYFVSIPLGANYTYSHRPPPTKSLLDMFGPWPIYWFVPQFICYPAFFALHKMIGGGGDAKKEKRF